MGVSNIGGSQPLRPIEPNRSSENQQEIELDNAISQLNDLINAFRNGKADQSMIDAMAKKLDAIANDQSMPDFIRHGALEYSTWIEDEFKRNRLQPGLLDQMLIDLKEWRSQV